MAIETSGSNPRRGGGSGHASRRHRFDFRPAAARFLKPAARHARRLLDIAGGIWRRIATAIAPVTEPIGRWFTRQWHRVGGDRFSRFLSSSLLRRIVMSNLLGLAILFAGALYLSQFNIWLIDSKRETLEVRALTIASALASETSLRTTGDLPQTDPPDRPSLFPDLEFSLDPARVARKSRHLLSQTKSQFRTRVYDTGGSLVYDSRYAVRPDKRPAADAQDKQTPNPKNLLTRMTQRLLRSDLRVYKDPGHNNGFAIREVRNAFRRSETQALILLTRKGRQVVSIATPIQRAGADKPAGVLLLSTHRKEIDRAADEQRMVVLAFALISLAAAMIASFMLARTVAGPMQELSEVAEDVTRNIHAAANLPQFDDREDEVGQLTRAFKTMTAALYSRVEASEKFAADVAHELKNPLAAAKSTAEAFDYAKTDEQRAVLIKQIQEEIHRLNNLISDVSNASRLDAELMRQHREPVDIAEAAQNVTTSFNDLKSGTGQRVALHFDPSVKASGAYVVSGKAEPLTRVLTNLVDNALSFSPPNGRVDITVRRDATHVQITIDDQGPGIDPEQLEAIFQRFYTYRPTAESSRGNNSGLGLSISREIIRAHDGEIWAENRASPTPDGQTPERLGARFAIRLPAADAPDPATQPRRRLSKLITRRSRRTDAAKPT